MPPKTTMAPLTTSVDQLVEDGRCHGCPGTTRRQAHRECMQRMCKQCCIAREGCTAPKHQPQHLSLRQRQKKRLCPLPASAPPLQDFTSMQHNLQPMPLQMQMLPPLSSSDMQILQDIQNSDPVVVFLANERQRLQEEKLAAEQERFIEQQEDSDFQAGLAASLGLPVALSSMPPASTAHHLPPLLSSTPIPQASSSTMTTPKRLHTLPYRHPNITHHMNSEWMRPFEDWSKETPKRRKQDPNQKF